MTVTAGLGKNLILLDTTEVIEADCACAFEYNRAEKEKNNIKYIAFNMMKLSSFMIVSNF
jgi:hypothetical protein